MKRDGPMLVLLCCLVLPACASVSAPARDLETERAALIRIEEEFSKAAEQGIAEAFVAFAAPDATMMPANQLPVVGREGIRAQFAACPPELA